MKLGFLFSLLLATTVIAAMAQERPSAERDAIPGEPRKTISLTLREAIEMALRDNLDVRIERMSPKLADTTVQSARSVFEPFFSFGANYAETKSPNWGAPSTRSERLQTSFGLGGLLETGTQYSLELDNTGIGTTFNNFDTEYTAFAGLSLKQPLLKNAWRDVNLTTLRVARKSKQQAEENLALRLMLTVTAVKKAYYDLAYTIEQLKVSRESLTLAEELLRENQARLRAGVMSPLDVTEAEAAVAARKEAVLVGERLVHDQANVLKQLITGDIESLLNTTLVPVDVPSIVEVPLDLQESIRTALRNRPDYLQAKLEIEKLNLSQALARNQLYPQTDLLFNYGLAGVERNYFPAYGKPLNFNHPAWGIGVAVTVPIGNQKAKADLAAAKIQTERAQLSLKRLEQDIIVQVDTALAQVRTNYKRIETARIGRRLAEEKLDAERKRLNAGTTTSFFVLQYQQDLAAARATELRAILDYNISLTNFYQAEGTVLKRLGIEVSEEK